DHLSHVAVAAHTWKFAKFRPGGSGTGAAVEHGQLGSGADERLMGADQRLARARRGNVSRSNLHPAAAGQPHGRICLEYRHRDASPVEAVTITLMAPERALSAAVRNASATSTSGKRCVTSARASTLPEPIRSRASWNSRWPSHVA